MFYRLAGVHHTSYKSAMRLWPVPADRWQVLLILAVALAAPFFLSSLHLGSYVPVSYTHLTLPTKRIV